MPAHERVALLLRTSAVLCPLPLGKTTMPAAVPTPEQVTAYLAAHSLESTIEEAVNDAVLKQVKVSTMPCSAQQHANRR